MVAQCGERIRQDALFDVRHTDSHLAPNVWEVVLPAAMSVKSTLMTFEGTAIMQMGVAQLSCSYVVNVEAEEGPTHRPCSLYIVGTSQ